MPKAKEQPKQMIECTICKGSFALDIYAAHVQSAHSAPQSTAFTPQPFNNNGGQQQPLQTLQGPIVAKELAGGNYLKGADIPTGTNEVRIKINRFVHDPRGRSKLAAEIPETYGKTVWGLNTTNIRALASLGFDDLQAVVGKTIVCMIGMAPNPQANGAMVKALFVARVE